MPPTRSAGTARPHRRTPPARLRLRTAPAALALLAAMLALPAPAPAADVAAGVQADLLANLDDAGDKILRLAQAIPADRYGWRPGEGVRSVSEVLMHIAAANFYIPNALAIAPPDGARPGREMEKITDKKQAVAELERSFDHARRAIESVVAGALGDEVLFFGRPSTKHRVELVILSHAHEHLGQLIAYARSIGITPPWSADES